MRTQPFLSQKQTVQRYSPPSRAARTISTLRKAGIGSIRRSSPPRGPAPPSGQRLKASNSFRSLYDQEQTNPRRSSIMFPQRAQPPVGPRDEGGMGKRWVRWMHKQGLKRFVVLSSVLAAVWVKWAVGLGSYSGQGTPPMFGDYEAQRHWLELTIHLPVRQWYTYDLQYWGLDYPPLTAYVSWLCGIVGSWIDPSWFALASSRGIETPGSKIYMRATVLAFDTLIYVPALIFFARAWQGTRSIRTQELVLLVLLFHPALALIDFGHFQYNSVMLGLTLLAINFFSTGHDLLGAVCFVLSLGFKQMALYYAPAIGSYLLGKCLYLGSTKGSQLFIRLALVTSATFLVLFLPFLPPFAPLSAIRDPIARIFPFARGLFEDKVANFWCASDVLVKWRRWASRGILVQLSAGLTALGFLPAAAGLISAGWKLRKRAQTAQETDKEKEDAATPMLPLLPYALLTSSMSFFLFSFQVHEKTILLPLLPMTLILAGAASAPGTHTSAYNMGMLVNNVAVFSMWPLLKRDGLSLQYVALTVFWNHLLGYNPFQKPRTFLQYLSIAVYGACAILHLLELMITPPSRLPDIYPVLNVLISTPVFVFAWLWSIKRGVEVGWALGGIGASSSRHADHKISASSTVANGPSSTGIKENSDSGIPAGAKPGTRRSLGFADSKRRAPFRTGSVEAS
ncbi:glycosyltransferase family 57 protein [Gelatoporia subvermispora B]|uniref:Alpha-1,3-glucosyltransferase n=1 Tax=Ceriporiopsis subvermispora (strain B) TaxID=914234 RepID=M2QRY4_CERS8|nr:glycosyltransferase family 57 protein [Gelatoporia subvermispora B]